MLWQVILEIILAYTPGQHNWEPFVVHYRSATETGRIGENLASRALKARGYEIIERNWRCDEGEIDIVARHREQWVFVEVKARRSQRYGLPEDAITAAKRKRLLRCGLIYVATHQLEDVTWRIDVVAIMLTSADEPKHIQIYENAVHADSREG
jgi:putative endonuclease